MQRVMAVEFGVHGRLHYLDAGTDEYGIGDVVTVPGELGVEVARCVLPPTEIDLDAVLPPCGGLASASDVERQAALGRRRDEIARLASQQIVEHGLPMTVVGVDETERDGAPLAVIYFKAPHRIDFRALLTDLGRVLQGRIDLRQVGARDVAALAGGVGICGRELCCCLLCPAKDAVPARASRDQEAANGALQLVGSCGRLKCCLTYETDAYADFAQRAPRVGSVVATDAGEGVVSGQALPADAVWVRGQDGTRAVPLGQLTVVRPAPGQEPDEPAPLASETNRPVPRPPSRRPFLRRPQRPQPPMET